MKTTTSIALILTTAIALTGCDPVEVLSGKPSSRQVQYEARQEAGLTPQENLWIETVKVDPPAPVIVAVQEPEPECQVSVFRIYSCVGGRMVEWQPGL